jgi:signal transduction histidine kinase
MSTRALSCCWTRRRTSSSLVADVVEDSGESVSDDLRPRLFEPFARTDSANVGSGLGLVIARAYARAHGGDLVYDRGVRGARFELIIPQDRAGLSRFE